MKRPHLVALLFVSLLGILAACSSAPDEADDSSSQSVTKCIEDDNCIIGPIPKACNCSGWTECVATTGQCIACGTVGHAPCGSGSKESGCEAPALPDGNACVDLSSTGACPGWSQLSSAGTSCTACGVPGAVPCTERSAGESGCEPSTVLIAGVCASCGANGQPACTGGVCNTGTSNMNGTCTVPCGSNGLPVCPHNVCNPGTSDTAGTCCATGTTSYEGYCVPCGGNGQVGCGGNGCWESQCSGGTCNPGYVLGSIGTENGVCVCGGDGMPACPGGCGAGTVAVGGVCECGANGQPPCTDPSYPTFGCDPGTVSVGSPATCFTCGGNGQPPCCPAGASACVPTLCDPGLTLASGGSYDGLGECACGGVGQPACPGNTCPATSCKTPPCGLGTDSDGAGVIIQGGLCTECGLTGDPVCSNGGCAAPASGQTHPPVPINGACVPLVWTTWSCSPAEVSCVAFTAPLTLTITNTGNWLVTGALNNCSPLGQDYAAAIALSAVNASGQQYSYVEDGTVNSEINPIFGNNSNNSSWSVSGVDPTIPANWSKISTATAVCNLGISLNAWDTIGEVLGGPYIGPAAITVIALEGLGKANEVSCGSGSSNSADYCQESGANSGYPNP